MLESGGYLPGFKVLVIQNKEMIRVTWISSEANIVYWGKVCFQRGRREPRLGEKVGSTMI